jgi:hypothetical protein
LQLFAQSVGEGVEVEGESISLVEFVVELHPVQTKSVQEALETVHAQQNTESNACQEDETD